MAHTPTDKKPVLQTVAYGLGAVALYAGIFSHADAITAQFSQGALWAAGPILTVFAVSWVHGAFAHNLWTCLGITARQPSKDAHTTARPQTQPAARPQARATLNA
jgi:hypothetical protein